MKIFATCLLASAFISGVSGCGILGQKKDSATSNGAPSKHAVAVVDEGFDIENSNVKSNLKAAYRVLCVNTGTNPLLNIASETRFEDLKAGFLAYLKNRSECVAKAKLNDNISPKFATIAGVYNEWNAAVRDGTKDSLNYRETVEGILGGEDGKFNYHGTAVAGLISTENKNVDLYIIEPDLLQLMIPNDVYKDLGCRSQVAIDLKAKLFEDDEVRTAFVDPNRSDADYATLETLKSHGVTIINESFGPTTAGEFTKYYKKKNCPEVNFKRMIQAESRLARERHSAIEEKLNYRPLHVRASGNAGENLNLESDTLDPCRDEDNFLLVGALDSDEKVADFSNRGRCVEVYTLGKDVIIDAPKNYLGVKNGTSFSAPLITRWLTLNATPGLDEKALRQAVLKNVDADQRIKMADWNKQFAYKPKAAGVNPAPNPVPNPGNNDLKAGWTEENLKQNIDGCIAEVVANGNLAEKGQRFCSCSFNGLARKYTYDEVQQAGTNVGQDPIVTQCKQQVFGQ